MTQAHSQAAAAKAPAEARVTATVSAPAATVPVRGSRLEKLRPRIQPQNFQDRTHAQNNWSVVLPPELSLESVLNDPYPWGLVERKLVVGDHIWVRDQADTTLPTCLCATSSTARSSRWLSSISQPTILWGGRAC